MFIMYKFECSFIPCCPCIFLKSYGMKDLENDCRCFSSVCLLTKNKKPVFLLHSIALNKHWRMLENLTASSATFGDVRSPVGGKISVAEFMHLTLNVFFTNSPKFRAFFCYCCFFSFSFISLHVFLSYTQRTTVFRQKKNCGSLCVFSSTSRALGCRRDISKSEAPYIYTGQTENLHGANARIGREGFFL